MGRCLGEGREGGVEVCGGLGRWGWECGWEVYGFSLMVILQPRQLCVRYQCHLCYLFP